MKKLILISGKAQHGKDSLANIMIKNLDAKSTKVSMARELKYLAQDYFGWNGQKDEKGRKLLQWLGTDYIRQKIDQDFHVKRAIDTIKVIQEFYDYIFIPDIRFKNEIELLHQTFPNQCLTIRVFRTNYQSPYSDQALQHPSETELDDYHFDYYIEAENLQELEKKANKIFESILEDYKPVDELTIGDVVIVKDIKNKEKAKHLLSYIGKKGIVYSYINFLNKPTKYKIWFDFEDTAYFTRHELEKLKGDVNVLQ